MAQNRHREGETRTCPYCGQAATFSHQTRVPGSTDHSDRDAQYRPGWTCENRHCWKRYDLEE
jgi:hypothetical protein